MEDRYVDTADGALGRAGFAVRLRQSRGKTIVSIKSLTRTDGPGGSVRREEFEGPADRVGAAVDWPASDARALVLEHAGDAPLVELVTVRQLRRKRQLKSAAEPRRAQPRRGRCRRAAAGSSIGSSSSRPS